MEAHLGSEAQPTLSDQNHYLMLDLCNVSTTLSNGMENLEQAFVEYASSRDRLSGSNIQDVRLSKIEADFKRQQGEMTNKIDTVLKAITDQIADTLPSDTVTNLKLGTHPVSSARSYPTMDPQCSTQIHSSINAIMILSKQQSDSHDDRTKKNKEEKGDSPKNHSDSSTPPDPSISFIIKKVLKFNSLFESLGLVPPSPNAELVCTTEEDGDVMCIEIIPKDDNSHKEESKAGVQEVDYFDMFPSRSELAYHKYLMCGPIPSIFLRNLIIIEGCPSNLKIPCNIGHVHIMRIKLNPRENTNGGISNFMGKMKGMHVFIGNFTYVVDFMIVEDTSSIIDPRFTNENDEVAYKMPHMIKQYNSLSDLEKEHTKLVYLRNKEDKRRRVDYVMSKILGFYKECLELGPEYVTEVDEEGEVT
ncbi:hypothetical protein Tco_1046153, partial [Tanacetum coccineum]